MSTSTATRLRALPPRAEATVPARPRLVVAAPSTGANKVRRRVDRPAWVLPPARRFAAERRGVHLTGRGRVLLVLVLAALLLGAFAVGRSASSQATTTVSTPAPALTQVTVQSGDTLWTLARRLAPGRDNREVVDQLRRLNHLSSASDLKVGQQLLLPTVV